MKPENIDDMVRIYKLKKRLQYLRETGLDEVIQSIEKAGGISINNFFFESKLFQNLIMEIEGVLLRTKETIPICIESLNKEMEEIL